MRCIAVLLSVLPLPAIADCPAGGQVFSCQVGAKALEICHVGDDLTYAFGPRGAPELTITEPLKTVNFAPWPGVGSNIWEAVIFVNDDYAYEVWTSVAREPEATKGLQGGVRVLNGEEMVAELTCDQGTASNALDVIWDLKESVGMCWEFASISWKTSCNN